MMSTTSIINGLDKQSKSAGSQDKEKQVEELRKYYPHCHTKHVDRGLKFHPDKTNKLYVLAGFPRSGSSLLDNIIENVSGYFAGEDMPIETSVEAIAHGNVRATVNYCRIFRTHYPWIAKVPWREPSIDVQAHRAVVLVRNPFKSIVSLFAMITTNSHTVNLDKTEYIRRASEWDLFVRCVAQGFQHFCNFWANTNVPVLFIRYEDLIVSATSSTSKIFAFLEGVRPTELQEVRRDSFIVDLDGSKSVQDRVDDHFRAKALSSTLSRGQKSKENQYGFYTEEQMKYVYEVNKKWMDFFGWSEEVRENCGESVVTEVKQGQPEFESRNEKMWNMIDKYRDEESVRICNQDGEFEKSWVDPITPMYNYTLNPLEAHLV